MDWLLLVASGVITLHPLTFTWDREPNYSFGWMIPLVAFFLFHERWGTRPVVSPTDRVDKPSALLFFGILLFIFLRLVIETNPSWRPGLWGMTLLYVAGLLFWLQLYGGKAWLRHFAFPVCFLLFCLPWPYQIESPLTQSLMRLNTQLTAGSLQLLGFSAEAYGNIIQLPGCTLFVEEACSGILSLQASLMMGFLLGEIYQLPVKPRCLLAAVSLLLALAGNYGRTLFLSLMAEHSGKEAVTRWHDRAGFGILAFAAISSWLVCLWLKNKAGTVSQKAGNAHNAPPTFSNSARRLALLLLVTAILSEAGIQLWFGWNEARMERRPAWVVNFTEISGFKKRPLAEVTRRWIMCDDHSAGEWRDEAGRNWTVFWFRYNSKAYNKAVLGTHTPDSCLPASGMTKEREFPAFDIVTCGIRLSVQAKEFSSRGVHLYVFWIVYPLSGEAVPETVNEAKWTLMDKVSTHLEDIRRGYRGVGAETLEIVLTGVDSYEAARAAFDAEIRSLVLPVTPTETVTTPYFR